MHVDYPWDVALSRVVSVPGVLQRWRGYFAIQVTPCWYWIYGLEATFLFSFLLFRGTGARGLHARTVASYHAAPSTASLPVGIEGWHHLGQSTLLGQRVTPLRWETLKLGDGHSWRCPHLATPTPGNAQSGQHPHFPPLVGSIICLTLVNAPQS